MDIKLAELFANGQIRVKHSLFPGHGHKARDVLYLHGFLGQGAQGATYDGYTVVDGRPFYSILFPNLASNVHPFYDVKNGYKVR